MSESLPEHVPSRNNDPSREFESIDDLIEALLSELDLRETPELNEARRAILIALGEETNDPARRREAWFAYADIAERIDRRLDPTPSGILMRTKVHTVLTIHKALIFRDAGITGRYVEELDRAETIARANRFEPVLATIRAELETLIDNSNLSPEGLLYRLKGEITSDLHLELLRDDLAGGANYEDIYVGSAYALQSDGKDPAEVFNRLGIMQPN